MNGERREMFIEFGKVLSSQQKMIENLQEFKLVDTIGKQVLEKASKEEMRVTKESLEMQLGESELEVHSRLLQGDTGTRQRPWPGH